LFQNGGLSVLSSTGETELHCCDATANSFATKVQDEVFAHFHADAVKRQ
jgi:hypothetical protein